MTGMPVQSPWFVVILAGAVLGIFVGLAGTGGAFIIPALVYGFGMTQIRAQGTALFIAASPVWIVPMIPYARAKHVDWRIGILIAVGLALGSYFGAQWAQTLPVATVRKGFALVLLGLALKMFFQR